MQRSKLGNAVVIGGSMAGLLAARVLADHFNTVTLIERDERSAQPEFRRGVPQGSHAHVLLLRGQQTIFRLFPAARQALIDAGAHVTNMGRDLRWFHLGAWKCRYDSALQGITASRPLIEWTVGEQLRRLANVRSMDGWSVESFLYDGSRISGVRARSRTTRGIEEMIPADLVVDAGGRGSQTPVQLRALGFERPQETAIKIDVGYATRIYRMPASVPDWKLLYVMSEPPAKRGGVILPLEGNRWMVTQVGMHGDHPPGDERGFLAFAKTLPMPDLYEALRQAEPLSSIARYGFLSGLRRHYEKLRRFPAGLLVLGDALCSFNPVYGQGMSAASMYADALAHCLQEQVASGLPPGDLWKSFFPRAARVADMPWELATSEDFRHAETIGRRGPASRFLHWYTSKVHEASSRSPQVAERLYEVMHLLKAPLSLFDPRIAWRVMRRGPRAQSATPAARSKTASDLEPFLRQR